MFQLTDLDGVTLRTCWDHQGGEVMIPKNDSRTAKVTLSVYNEVVTQIGTTEYPALERMLKVYYIPHQTEVYLVFWGVIIKPHWNFSQGTVEVNAHDPSLAWKKGNHHYGDTVVGTRTRGGFPMDGRGIRMLAESVMPNVDQLARGVRGPGILWGINTVPNEKKRPADLNKPNAATDGVWSLATRGQQVFESIQNVVEAADGPDWQLRPTDDFKERGFFAYLDTFARQGKDRTGQIVWHYGFGRNNLENMEWEPDGDAVKNWAIEVAPGGPSTKEDTGRIAAAHKDGSFTRIGIYENWESSNNKDTQQVLQTKANAWVAAYGTPPDLVTLTLRPERYGTRGQAESPYKYMTDFQIGDVMRAVGRKGYAFVDLQGEAQSVTLTATTRTESRTSVELAPYLEERYGDVTSGPLE